MARVIFTHLYVIIMATVVVMTGNILADRYGDDIVSGLHGMVQSTDDGMAEMKNSVKDWNKHMLD